MQKCLTETNAKARYVGFTLIELLVVIAILVLLAGLMLPGLHRAKRAARCAVCTSNLRQIGITLDLYVSDLGQYPNLPVFVPGAWGDLSVRGELSRYFPNGTRGLKDGFYCPVGMIYFYNSLGTGYPNGWGLRREVPLGLGGAQDMPLPESGVSVPVDMLAFLHNFEWFTRPIGFGWPGVPGGWHDTAVFCDAHVEASDPKLLTRQPVGEFIPDAIHEKRWNHDNQPHPETWPNW
jgi:prepilin-type N-terminal cleavage/methylation domain-containing protein